MRCAAYFNALDRDACTHGLDTRQIIEGVCLDPRIGGDDNDPSFSGGGYCLPKNTRQLPASYDAAPQNPIQANVSANTTRKDFTAAYIVKRDLKVVGIYRVVMKAGGDNLRASAIQGVMKRIEAKDIEVIVHEPVLDAAEFFRSRVVNDLAAFKQDADLDFRQPHARRNSRRARQVYSLDRSGGDRVRAVIALPASLERRRNGFHGIDAGGKLRLAR